MISRAALWPGNPLTPAAGMSAGPAEVQILEFRMIISDAEHRPRGKQLVKAQSAVKDIAAGQSKISALGPRESGFVWQ